MMTREQQIDALAHMLKNASRTSVAAGAQYAPGEPISTDADSAWRVVAETLVAYIDAKIGGRSDPEQGLREGVSGLPRQA